MLPAVQQAEIEQVNELKIQKKKRKRLMGVLKNRFTRESRLVPDLIYQIEAFERTVMALSSQSDRVIVKSFHRSTARDFRIQAAELDDQSKDELSGTSSDSSEHAVELSENLSLVISTNMEE